MAEEASIASEHGVSDVWRVRVCFVTVRVRPPRVLSFLHEVHQYCMSDS